MKYYYDFKEELAEAVNGKISGLEAAIVTILFSAVYFFADFEVVASNWVRVFLLLIFTVAIVAVFVVSLLAVSSINCVNKRNEDIAKYVAEFLIARKLVVGERAGID